MHKLIGLIKRPEPAGRDEFMRRFLAFDAPQLLRRTPKPVQLVVNLVDVEPPGATDGAQCPPYDVVLEVWVDDPADIAALVQQYEPGAATSGLTAWLYAVSERIQLDHERTWPIGQRTPGVKVIYLTRRPDGLDAREAARLWREHAPLARRHHTGMSRYVQNGVIEALTPGAPVVHGVAVLHFPTLEDLEQRMYDSPEGREVIAADAARLVAEAIPLYTSEYILR